MRRFLALAALMFALASCQTEPEVLDVQVADEVNTTISVSILGSETRSDLGSSRGVFDSGILDGAATMRYQMVVYDENDQPTQQRYVKYADGKSVAFDVRLAPQRKYTFVVWADVVTGEDKGDNHYNTENLASVTIIDTEDNPWSAMDESRDAFTGKWTEDSFTGASVINVPLKRALAKLRLVTTDYQDAVKSGATPASATVTYLYDNTNSGRMAFNAFMGEACATTLNTSVIETVTYPVDVYSGQEVTLFEDYLFANDDVLKFTLEVKEAASAAYPEGRRIKLTDFNTDIPVKCNNLTTITGALLTNGAGINVVIEETSNEDKLNYQEEQLRRLGKIGGSLTLNESVEISAPIVIEAGVVAEINLNGFDIINTTASEVFGEGEGIISYGELTINGEGTVQGSTMAVWARGNDGAVVNIYGGTYMGCAEGFAKGGRSVIYASSDNTINIYGGTFKALAADKTSYADKTNGVYAALNVADNNGFINVYGGTFYMQNPAAPGTEPAKWNAEHPNGFVANRHKSTLVDGSTTDYVVSEIPPVTTSDELLAAVAQGGYVKLGKDISLEARISVPTGAEVYLDMNGKSICVEEDYTDERVIYVPAGSSLIIDGNGTIEAHTPNPVIFTPFGDLVIENGTFIRVLEDGYTGTISSMFLGTKPGGWETYGVTINGGYFDSGYYDTNAADIEDYLAGTKTLVETEDDKAKRGNSKDSNVVRVALKQNVMKLINRSYNYFHVYGGTFVGANPAWGDEGGWLPVEPQYLRPWSNYQGGFIPGQEKHNDGIVLPEGFAITKGTHKDGRPTYTVTYNK